MARWDAYERECEIANPGCNAGLGRIRRLTCYRCGQRVCDSDDCSQIVRWNKRRIRLCWSCDQNEGLWNLSAAAKEGR